MLNSYTGETTAAAEVAFIFVIFSSQKPKIHIGSLVGES